MEINSDPLTTIKRLFDRFIENHPAVTLSYSLLDDKLLSADQALPVVQGLKVSIDKKLFCYVTVKEEVIEFDPRLTMRLVRSDGILTEADIRSWIEQARFADIT